VVAVLALTGFITAATAQNVPRAPQAPPQQPLNLHPGNGSSAGAPNGGPQPDYSPGWNYVHATNCWLYNGSDGYTYLVLYPQEGGDFWTSSPQFQNMLMTACQTGNWIALDIYDSYGDWSALYTYDSK